MFSFSNEKYENSNSKLNDQQPKKKKKNQKYVKIDLLIAN